MTETDTLAARALDSEQRLQRMAAAKDACAAAVERIRDLERQLAESRESLLPLAIYDARRAGVPQMAVAKLVGFSREHVRRAERRAEAMIAEAQAELRADA
jgi:hypothetical protein